LFSADGMEQQLAKCTCDVKSAEMIAES